MMIESERTRSVAFWSGRLSMPTSRMFLVPLIVTCCCGWPGSSSWVWLKLPVAAAKISFWPMMTVPLPSMMSAPKITSSLAHSGSFGRRPDRPPLPRRGGGAARRPRLSSPSRV